jgi:hypothetical protein
MLNNTGVACDSTPLFGNLVDWMLMGGGSILVYVPLSLRGISDSTAVGHIATCAMILVNWPHFAATLWRVYFFNSVPQRALVTRGVLLLMALSAVVAFAFHEEALPALTYIFVGWSGFHFASQNFGISMLYARRAQILVQESVRLTLKASLLTSVIALLLLSEASGGDQIVFGVCMPRLTNGSYAVRVCAMTAAAMSVALLCPYLLFVASRWKEKGYRTIMLLSIPAVTQIVWFVVGPRSSVYMAMVPTFHGAQYLCITHYFGRQSGKLRRVPDQLMCGVGLVVCGIVMFWAMPNSIHAIVGGRIASASIMMIMFVQLHHFVIDGIIWKLRRAENASLMNY